MFVPKKRIAEYKDGVRITVYSTPLVLYLESILGMKLNRKKSHIIKIPHQILKSSADVMSSFLRGAYGGDGYIGDKKIEYGTMSRELIEGIAYVLTALGVKYKFWKRKDGMYLITISGKLEMQKTKQVIFGTKPGERIRRQYNAQYRVPDVSGLIRKAKETLNLRYGKEIPEGLFEGVISQRKRCGKIRIQRIFEYIDRYATPDFKTSETYRSLRIISKGDLSWTRVVNKRRSAPRWMYDLETGISSFTGGNLPMLLHNSKWVGESERGVRETFHKAKMAAPAIVFFDEIDALVPRRGSGMGDSNVTERVISQLLTELDGLEKLENVVVIGSTNRPDLVDPALIRPGRFDRLVLISGPEKKTRLDILKIHTKKMSLTKDVDLELIAKETEGYSGSDLASLCREAAMLVLRKDIKGKEVKMQQFKDAMEMVRPSISPEVEKSYQSFVDRIPKRAAQDATNMHY
ncbi:MAG: AAA family ATPase [Methanobacteriota archaeon]